MTSTSDEAAHEAVCGLPVGASRVREAVAERYKHSVSYREFLAAEAERAVAQAQAQVEIATRNVAAVAAAQTKLMEELELWPVQEVSAAARVEAGEVVQGLPGADPRGIDDDDGLDAGDAAGLGTCCVLSGSCDEAEGTP